MAADHQDTTQDTLSTDVLVVGAGPAGLMLACELRLGGAEVLVLDQRPGPTTESRASTLHARTMEILAARGLLAELGTPPCEPRGHFGGIGLDLTLPTSHPGQWKVPQQRTEELLQDRAIALGADVRRRHQLVALADGPDRVTAECLGPAGPVRITARFLVGCDGEDSTVRRLIGADFPGRDAERELLRADVSGVDTPDRRFQRLANGLAIAATRGEITRVMVHEFGTPARRRSGAPEFAEVVHAWQRVTGEDISHGVPLWINAFGDANRQLAQYRHGRILFAGDAAHQQMPSGGQALNLGVQDSFNLGWKLAAEVRGDAPEGLLDSYHAERHAVGAKVLANIRAQTHLLLGGPEIEPVRAVLGELIALEEVRTHLAGMISGLSVRYDVRHDVRHDAGGSDGHPDDGHPLLGRRLPPAELIRTGGSGGHSPGDGEVTTGTPELLTAGRGLLLDLGAGAEPAARPWADRVDTVTARPAPGSPLRAGEALLVRPDGHVAWAGPATDADGLRTALRRWFGEPDRTQPRTPAAHHSTETAAAR
ncbi:FAD-dependent monooxygenase [Streptomyces sp. ISL-36]|uniref:FAD-dependent monooxygenase n=2 Tax=Streptomyces sp. ISL-36 TaxID=2819182 RepID=UPI001BE87679|nr:FAD-dependent monooxygenase [Streptomyces sp. ISL-36]MBT2445271.1 FAD-dependent monooxygenase [Streptomyces sp. ISL-36]